MAFLGTRGGLVDLLDVQLAAFKAALAAGDARAEAAREWSQARETSERRLDVKKAEASGCK